MPSEGWLLLAYVVGTVFGIAVGYSFGSKTSVQRIIDALIQKEFLKTRELPDGSIEILKHYEE